MIRFIFINKSIQERAQLCVYKYMIMKRAAGEPKLEKLHAYTDFQALLPFLQFTDATKSRKLKCSKQNL